MKRPEFITNEDLLRWNENINNDTNIPENLKNNIIIKEVCIAGQWLSEELIKLNC